MTATQANVPSASDAVQRQHLLAASPPPFPLTSSTVPPPLWAPRKMSTSQDLRALSNETSAMDQDLLTLRRPSLPALLGTSKSSSRSRKVKRPSSAGEDADKPEHRGQLNDNGSYQRSVVSSLAEGDTARLSSQQSEVTTSTPSVRKMGSKYSFRNLFRKYSDTGDSGPSTPPLPTRSIQPAASSELSLQTPMPPTPTSDSGQSLPPSNPPEHPIVTPTAGVAVAAVPLRTSPAPLPLLLGDLGTTDTRIVSISPPKLPSGLTHWNRTRKASEVAVSSPLASESFLASPGASDGSESPLLQQQQRDEVQKQTKSLSPPVSPRSVMFEVDSPAPPSAPSSASAVGTAPRGLHHHQRRASSQSGRALRFTDVVAPSMILSLPSLPRSIHRASSSTSSGMGEGRRQHDGIGEVPEVIEDDVDGDTVLSGGASDVTARPPGVPIITPVPKKTDEDRRTHLIAQALGLVPAEDTGRNRGDSLSSMSDGSANNAQSQSSLSTSSTADTMLTAPSVRAKGDPVASPQSVGPSLKEEGEGVADRDEGAARLVVSVEELRNVTSRADAERLRQKAEEDILALASEFTSGSEGHSPLGGRKSSLAEQLEAYGQAVQLERRFVSGETQKDVKIDTIGAHRAETDGESSVASLRGIGLDLGLGSPSRLKGRGGRPVRGLNRASSLEHASTHRRSPSIGTSVGTPPGAQLQFTSPFDSPLRSGRQQQSQRSRTGHRPIANMSSLQHKRSLEASLVKRNAKGDLFDYDDEGDDDIGEEGDSGIDGLRDEFGQLRSRTEPRLGQGGGGDIEIIRTLPTPTESPTSILSSLRRSTRLGDEPHSPTSPTSPTGSTHSHAFSTHSYSRNAVRGYSEDSGGSYGVSDRIRSPAPLNHQQFTLHDPLSSTSRERELGVVSPGRNQTVLPAVMGLADYAPVEPVRRGKRARLKHFVVQTLKGK
ncbi:uncharacterized protein EI90DRAFT_3116292 [Cantharellus anzutake]|uniref:uncharacterized protein n=1 Tax=Cantharellus anzutake TaxID=1750568 RepID=UPI00190649C2|nr:uncharacterized protein EI90DRAFT_3116292 [Cantharellus anzutake]KAF8342344.1 hypothetical protein EI90DRAFT_3116292 [Cantharellus anzutake]